MSTQATSGNPGGPQLTIHLLKFGVSACPDNHKWVGEDQKELVNCSACLEGLKHGDPTFEILNDGKAIKCRRCGSISHNPNDVENHWCGRCHMSHDDIWPPARRAWVASYVQPS